MAADLYIHAMTPEMTERHLAEFFSHTMGSKWFNLSKGRRSDESFDLIANSPKIHVGEVSWLKAALFEDADTFIPEAVIGVSEIIGEDLPIIDDALIAKISEALKAPNQTVYEVSGDEPVLAFLNEHKGKRAFTVSW